MNRFHLQHVQHLKIVNRELTTTNNNEGTYEPSNNKHFRFIRYGFSSISLDIKMQVLSS